jgi:hypothetical protein
MAKNDDTTGKGGEVTNVVSTDALAAAFAAALKSVQPAKELKEGDPEYVERQRQEGWFDDFFGKTVWQNAYEAQARGLSEEVRRKASELKPGTYIKGRVRVEHLQNGQIIQLNYPTKGDAMMINMQHWSSFSDLVTKIHAEQNEAVTA